MTPRTGPPRGSAGGCRTAAARRPSSGSGRPTRGWSTPCSGTGRSSRSRRRSTPAGTRGGATPAASCTTWATGPTGGRSATTSRAPGRGPGRRGVPGRPAPLPFQQPPRWSTYMRGVHGRAAAVLGAAVLAGLAGCNRDRTAQEVAAMNTSNVQRVANLYTAHQTYKGGRGPANEAEFKEFITQFDKEKLQMMGVNPGELAGLFTSERDGKPLKVRYNVGGGRGAVAPVVFEQDGKDGKRQVGFTGNAKVEEVDAA